MSLATKNLAAAAKETPIAAFEQLFHAPKGARPGVSACAEENSGPRADRNHQTLRSGQGFCGLAKRWIVERTFACLGRCRRLAKDFENLNRKALAFLRLACIRLMLRKLCNPI